MQTVPGSCQCPPTDRKPTKRQDGRFYTISSDRSQLRWTNQIPYAERTQRWKGVHRALFLHPYQGPVLRVSS